MVVQHVTPGARYPGLDGVRGLAVLAVMLHHLSEYVPAGSLAGKAIKQLFFQGSIGVDLFFVLSGFLITGILLDTKAAPNYFRSFYVRRMLRIFPLYYAVLSTIILVGGMFPASWPNPAMPSRHDQLFYFFYLNNWWPLLHDAWHANVIGHFWSLAVEEQFYFIWPLCIWLLPRKWIPRLCVAGIVTAFALRVFLLLHSGADRNVFENTFARMDPLLAGALIACLVRSKNAAAVEAYIYGPAIVAGLLYLALGSLGAYNFPAYQVIAFSFLAIAFAGFVLFVVSPGRKLGILVNQRLSEIGKYSYGMYVYHVPLMSLAAFLVGERIALGRNGWSSAAFICGVMLLTFLGAKLSFNLFEKRFLRLKDAFKAGDPVSVEELPEPSRI